MTDPSCSSKGVGGSIDAMTDLQYNSCLDVPYEEIMQKQNFLPWMAKELKAHILSYLPNVHKSSFTNSANQSCMLRHMNEMSFGRTTHAMSVLDFFLRIRSEMLPQNRIMTLDIPERKMLRFAYVLRRLVWERWVWIAEAQASGSPDCCIKGHSNSLLLSLPLL